MNKFRITRPDGNQFELETDKSYAQVVADFPSTTDIQPIGEVGTAVESEKPIAKKPGPKAKVKPDAG